MKLRYLPLLLLAAAPAFAAAPAAPESAAFSKAERDVLRPLLQKEVRDALAQALSSGSIDANAPISIVAIAGDRNHYLEGLAKIAVTAAGLTYVEGRSDPMFNAIVDEINWDGFKVDILDAATLAKFGSLKATRQLLYGNLLLDADETGRPQPELTLHISSVVTKEHVWGGTFTPEGFYPWTVVREKAIYVQEPVASLLTAKVVVNPADDLSIRLGDRLVPVAKDELVKRDFKVVPSDGDADVVVRFQPKLDAKDRTADFVAFRGQVPVDAYLPGLADKSFGASRIEMTGGLVQDDDPALSDLVSKIDQPLRDWIAQHVTAEACGLRVEDVTVSYKGYDGNETSARITQFCDAARKLKGVVSCTLASRLDPGNKAVYRVVYEAGAFPNGFLHALIAENPELELIVELSK